MRRSTHKIRHTACQGVRQRAPAVVWPHWCDAHVSWLLGALQELVELAFGSLQRPVATLLCTSSSSFLQQGARQAAGNTSYTLITANLLRTRDAHMKRESVYKNELYRGHFFKLSLGSACLCRRHGAAGGTRGKQRLWCTLGRVGRVGRVSRRCVRRCSRRGCRLATL